MNQNSTVTKETGRDPLGVLVGEHFPGLGAMVQQMDEAFRPMREVMSAVAQGVWQLDEALRPTRVAIAAVASGLERTVSVPSKLSSRA